RLSAFFITKQDRSKRPVRCSTGLRAAVRQVWTCSASNRFFRKHPPLLHLQFGRSRRKPSNSYYSSRSSSRTEHFEDSDEAALECLSTALLSLASARRPRHF